MKDIRIDSLEKLFNNVDLYNKLDFEIFEISGNSVTFSKNEIFRFFRVLGLIEKRITTFCKDCKMNYPFEIKVSGNEIIYKNRYVIGLKLTKGCSINLNEKDINFNVGDAFSKNELIDDGVWYLEYTFKCTNEPDTHIYRMYLLVSKKGNVFSLTKIGQHPSIIDIHGFDFDCYRKQLESYKAYDDFRKAELCNVDGFSAGAYTYLRRVFEKMLNKYCEGVKLEDNRTETKIKTCEGSFDIRVRKLLKRLYKILSKGIHQLSDEESKNYYEYLRIIIVMQLEFIKEKDDNESQTQALDSQLNDIIAKIGE